MLRWDYKVATSVNKVVLDSSLRPQVEDCGWVQHILGVLLYQCVAQGAFVYIYIYIYIVDSVKCSLFHHEKTPLLKMVYCILVILFACNVKM